MLLLYYGSGSQEIQLVAPCNEEVWSLLKRGAVRYLRLSGSADCADILEQHPFEMWTGTNGFGDDFELLYLRVAIKEYLDFELLLDSFQAQSQYAQIADAMKQMNNAIRFIAVDAMLTGSDAVQTPQLEITSTTVERALSDFEALARSAGGAVSGVDRIHTALHAYLKAVCSAQGIPHNSDAKITELFKLIRKCVKGGVKLDHWGGVKVDQRSV
jgi:hypothetical protein